MTRDIDVDTMLMQNNAEKIVISAFEKVFFEVDNGFFSGMLLELGKISSLFYLLTLITILVLQKDNVLNKLEKTEQLLQLLLH